MGALIGVAASVLLSVLILGKTSLGSCAVRKCCCLSLVSVIESLSTLLTKLGAVLALAGTGLFGFKHFLDSLGIASSFYEIDEGKLLGGGVVLVLACILMLVANFMQCCCVAEVSTEDDSDEDVVKSTEVEVSLDANSNV